MHAPSWLLLVAVAACGGPDRSGRAPDHKCDDAPPETRAEWRHRVRATLAGSPRHVVSDPIVRAGSDADVTVKLAYGKLNKDLEDEAVSIWVRRAACKWQRAGEAVTDDDGRARVTIPAALVSPPGVYELRAVVRGDLSAAAGAVYALAPGTAVVVFDVDGTLTTGDSELIEDLAGDGAPDVRAGAPEVARRYAAAGYLPVYVTGRPYTLRARTVRWLDAHQFPRGPLIVTDRLRDSLPAGSSVGAFKSGALRRLTTGAGATIAAAYGNAATDVCAYAALEPAPTSAFIIGGTPPRCGDAPALTAIDSYVDHAKTLAIEPATVPAPPRL